LGTVRAVGEVVREPEQSPALPQSRFPCWPSRSDPSTATVFRLSPAKLAAQLFPKNQAAAARAYLNGVQQYPGFYGPPATSRSQVVAAQRSLAGQDAAGRLVGDIRVPTLVAG
jgi:hypothetical protein